jgi:hypothetical protein
MKTRLVNVAVQRAAQATSLRAQSSPAGEVQSPTG